ncbi:serine protease, partial [Vibrio anguillarum]|nr:serine protease [Vibrio anguillarum]
PWIEEGGWLRSAPMADAEQSVLQLENVPQGKLHFDFQVSSESGDLFIAKVNGVKYIMEHGEKSGSNTLYLNKDFNNIRFEYIKKSDKGSGTDAA